MDRIPVTSSSIVSVGYNPDTKTLEVEFVNGGIYQYFDVRRSIYDALMAANSKGAFVSDHIKGNFFYERV